MQAAETPWKEISLETERLRVRPPTADDSDSLWEMLNDPKVWGETAPVSPDEARARNAGWLRGWEEEGIGGFVIETLADQHVVGRTGLMVFDSRTWEPSSFADAGAHA